MYDAKMLSEKIRMKRKKIRSGEESEVIDTSAGPLMNPQDIYNTAKKAQIEDTLDVPDKSSAPEDPADETLDETQKEEGLKRRMARVRGVFSKLRPSR